MRSTKANALEPSGIPILADIMDDHTGVDPLHPTPSRTVIKHARIKPGVREAGEAVTSLEATAELTHYGLSSSVRNKLDVGIGKVGVIPSCRKGSPIAMPKPAGLENFNNF